MGAPLPYSPEIPWVLAAEGPGHYEVMCTVCGARGHVTTTNNVGNFALHHRVHRAPDGQHGLGDAVAAVAKPIARLFGQKAPCTPCEARRHRLNAFRW